MREERETVNLVWPRPFVADDGDGVEARAPSTVSHEHVRNALIARYRACTAPTLAASQTRQPRRSCKLMDPWLRQYVLSMIA